MPIQILPPQLANQIAAGEVVERPASVVKELVENCLDAGASKVEIEIDRGGSKRILIRDNGIGIGKSELALALSRHATSKVASLDDLESILSFGFRGEALASISSVSRLTLTSKTQDQPEAWQAYAEGQEMAVKVQPAAHPVGTSVLVEDLFFNTPARRRFLRADKTEFNHIDEALRRIALAKPSIHFVLSHNGKLVRQYRSARTERQHQQRLAAICGGKFAEAAFAISAGNEQLQLHGHLGIAQGEQSFSEVQYFYVNGRIVRDRLVNHALRQALELHGQRLDAGFVLHLELPPQEVDVNVHPAKHEVRFHQARYVHDFILQGLSDAIAQLQSPLAAPSAPSDEVEQGKPVHESQGIGYQPRPLQPTPVSEPVGQSQSHSASGQFGHSASGYSPSGQGSGGSVSAGHSYRPSPAPQQDAVANYGELMQPAAQGTTIEHKQTGWRWLTQLDGNTALIGQGEQLRLLPLLALSRLLGQQELLSRLPQGLVSQPLLLPVSVAKLEGWSELIESMSPVLRRLGVELAEQKQRLIIRKVPSLLRQANLAQVVPELLQWLHSFEAGQWPDNAALAAWLSQHGEFPLEEGKAMWQRLRQLDAASLETIMLRHGLPLDWRLALES